MTRPRPQARADDGAAAVLLLVLTPALFALGGLVLDGGRQLSARQQAADLAEQAARAGADQLDLTTLRSDSTSAAGMSSDGGPLDVPAARAAACRYVTTADPAATCTATADTTGDGQRVTVRVRTVSSTVLLGLIGVNQLHADATATAVAVTGIRTTLGHG